MGFTHFDLPELKAARPPESHPETYRLVLLLYGWWCGMTGLLSWNILSSIILTSTIKGGAHPQLAILYSLVEFGIMSPVGLLTLLKGYHGWAENAGRDKTIVRVSVPIFLLISFVFAIVCTGNVNGLAGLGSSAMFATATAACVWGVAGGGAYPALPRLLDLIPPPHPFSVERLPGRSGFGKP